MHLLFLRRKDFEKGEQIVWMIRLHGYAFLCSTHVYLLTRTNRQEHIILCVDLCVHLPAQVLPVFAMDATKQLELLQSFDWTRPIEGNPDEHTVLRVTEDLDVFCNGELEGKIRQFRNGTLSYFGYTLHVDQSQEKVAWTPPPQRNKKEQKATVYWIRTNVLRFRFSLACVHHLTFSRAL